MKKFELAMQVGLVPRNSDTGKDITLRNASEHKRLEGHLKHLDHQLRSKLVSMQAEIMELKASQYEQNKKQKRRSPRLLESRDRAYSDGRLNQRGRPRTQTNDLLSNPNGPSMGPCTPEILHQKVNSKSELVLPEINLKQTSLVGNPIKSNDRNSFPPPESSFKRKTKVGPVSPVDNVLRSLSPLASIYRPHSLPDLSRLGPNSHKGGASPKSTRRVQFTIPESKVTPNYSVPDNSTLLVGEPDSILSETQATLFDRVSDFIKQTETPKIEPATENLETTAIEVLEVEKDSTACTENETRKDGESLEERDIFYNTMLTKGSIENGVSENPPDLASLGFMDFNDVIDKRLQQTQEPLPSEEEMRKIRYLRWRHDHEAPQLDLVKTVFDTGDESSIDAVDSNVRDLHLNDSTEPQLLNNNDEVNRLKSCDS